MTKKYSLTKIEKIAKKVEIPAPVLNHIAHLERCIKRAEIQDDEESLKFFKRRLVAYKKRVGVV